MKVLTIAGVSIIALSLVLGTAFPVLATSDLALRQASDIHPKMLAGHVISLDDNQGFFVIQCRGIELTVLVNADTQYFKVLIPRKVAALARYRPELKRQNQEKLELVERFRRFTQKATFDDIAVGAGVAVRAVPGEDNPLAKLVLIIEPTTYKRVIGTITDVSLVNKTITIAPADGNNDIILNYNEKTGFILRGTPSLQKDERVVAIYMEKDDGTLLAKRVMAGVEPLELAR
jgi:hypothetical protein